MHCQSCEGITIRVIKGISFSCYIVIVVIVWIDHKLVKNMTMPGPFKKLLFFFFFNFSFTAGNRTVFDHPTIFMIKAK